MLDLTGQRYGRLVVLNRSVQDHYKLDCRCDCGNMATISLRSLRAGATRSCGCLNRETAITNRTTHGFSHTAEYGIWNSMIRRCTNPTDIGYHNYGGRGIMVCQRWMDSFENFLADMGYRPTDDHSIDRFPDNDGNYEPGNCRWATWPEQMSHTRRTGNYEYRGNFYTAEALAAITGITNLVALRSRLYNGWDVERAVNTPFTSRQ